MLMMESSNLNESEEPQMLIPKDLMENIQSNSALQKLIPNLKELLTSACDQYLPELYAVRKAPELNSIQEKDPLNFFHSTNSNAEALDIQAEQKRDPVLRKVIRWIEQGCSDDLTYASFDLKKYHKHIARLQVKDGILIRQFFDDVGKVLHHQVCVPKHLRKEVIYRIHNSPTGGHLGIVRTAKEFRKRFYFPGFTEFLCEYIKNCLSCSTMKKVSKRELHPPLQPISSEQTFPGDMMQIDLVGPFHSPIYKYALFGIDVFSKYLFAVPLTSAHAGLVAKALVSIFFQHSYIQAIFLPLLSLT